MVKIHWLPHCNKKEIFLNFLKNLNFVEIFKWIRPLWYSNWNHKLFITIIAFQADSPRLKVNNLNFYCILKPQRRSTLFYLRLYSYILYIVYIITIQYTMYIHMYICMHNIKFNEPFFVSKFFLLYNLLIVISVFFLA